MQRLCIAIWALLLASVPVRGTAEVVSDNIVGISTTADGKQVVTILDSSGQTVLETDTAPAVELTNSLSANLHREALAPRIAPFLPGHISHQVLRGAKPPDNMPPNAMYGSLYARSARKSFYFVVYRDAALIKETGWKRLVIDQDEDKDLRNDPVIALDEPPPVEATLRLGGQPVECRIELDEKVLKIHQKYGMVGSARLGTGDVAVALIDATFDGRFTIGDDLLIDRNANGRFDTASQIWRRDDPERVKLTHLVYMDGCFFVPEIHQDASRIVLARKDTGIGTLDFVGEGFAAFRDGDVHLYLALADVPRHEGSFRLVLPADKFPLSMPAASYKRLYGYLSRTQDVPQVSFSISNLEIGADQTSMLRLDKPLMQVSVSQRGRQLRINQSLLTPQKIVYSRIHPTLAAAKSRKGPSISIARADTPDLPIHAGNMEYG